MPAREKVSRSLRNNSYSQIRYELVVWYWPNYLRIKLWGHLDWDWENWLPKPFRFPTQGQHFKRTRILSDSEGNRGNWRLHKSEDLWQKSQRSLPNCVPNSKEKQQKEVHSFYFHKLNQNGTSKRRPFWNKKYEKRRQGSGHPSSHSRGVGKAKKERADFSRYFGVRLLVGGCQCYLRGFSPHLRFRPGFDDSQMHPDGSKGVYSILGGAQGHPWSDWNEEKDLSGPQEVREGGGRTFGRKLKADQRGHWAG